MAPDDLRAGLRPDVTPVRVDDELLLLDRAAGVVVRLDAAATERLEAGSEELAAALGGLGLAADPGRRALLGAAALAGLGISVLALPGAPAAASPGAQGTPTVSTGAVASGFDPNVSALVRAIAVQSVDAIVIGGDFTAVGGTTRNRIARISATDGSVDATYNPSASAQVMALAVQSDGKVLVSGLFQSIGGTTRNYVARLHTNGAVDTDFNPSANGAVYHVAVQPDGRILLGGTFTSIGGATRNRVARFHANGILDTGFDPNLNGDVIWMAVQSDNAIVLGGSFSTVGGTSRNRIARVDANGALDTSFNAGLLGGVEPNPRVNSVVVQSDGRILLGGLFNFVGGESRKNLARVLANGALDTGFPDPTVTGGDVNRIAVQPDGAVVIAGNFTSVAGNTRNYVARFTAAGALDTGFDPNANGGIVGLAIQADGQILIGGAFTSVGGNTRNYLARLN